MLTQQTLEQNPPLRAGDLDHFHGSEEFYRHPIFKKFVYTEGVRHVADKGGANWLLEKIFACHMCVSTLQHQAFTVWSMERKGQGAKITVEDGNGGQLYKETILYTDFPLNHITFWMVDNTLLLPSEY